MGPGRVLQGPTMGKGGWGGGGVSAGGVAGRSARPGGAVQAGGSRRVGWARLCGLCGVVVPNSSRRSWGSAAANPPPTGQKEPPRSQVALGGGMCLLPHPWAGKGTGPSTAPAHPTHPGGGGVQRVEPSSPSAVCGQGTGTTPVGCGAVGQVSVQGKVGKHVWQQWVTGGAELYNFCRQHTGRRGIKNPWLQNPQHIQPGGGRWGTTEGGGGMAGQCVCQHAWQKVEEWEGPEEWYMEGNGEEGKVKAVQGGKKVNGVRCVCSPRKWQGNAGMCQGIWTWLAAGENYGLVNQQRPRWVWKGIEYSSQEGEGS